MRSPGRSRPMRERAPRSSRKRAILFTTVRCSAGVGLFEFTSRVGLLFNSNGVFDIPSFFDLGVAAPLCQRLSDQGLDSPLPIQAATIPDALSGRDICAQAPTGSGKTLAFALPLVTDSTRPRSGFPRALVLVPTRELAEQVRTVIAGLMGSRGRQVVALYGGVGYGPQRQALRRGADIVVACPGRLEDLVERRDVDLSEVRTVVLDEADRMVDMGFVRPVCRLMDQTSKRRQVLLFSATMSREVESIGRRYQHEPARVHVQAEKSQTDDVTHHFWNVPRTDRVKLTADLIAHHGQAFVFCRTKRAADRVARQLGAAGVVSAPIHGDRSQVQRTRALAAFADGRAKALVATDVVARGIHVDDVPCVIHFDLPADVESYVHRSGRTGRVGNAGTVVTLVPHEQRAEVRTLQRQLGFPAACTDPLPMAAAPPPSRSTVEQAVRSPRVQRSRREAMTSRVNGTVKFFDTRRGYGFLGVPGSTDVFVHHSNLRNGGPRDLALRKGERVVFDLVPGRRGHEARNVESVR
jgi:superfamily II DNA/RNA helicase